MKAIGQHLDEMGRNAEAWNRKPILRRVYAGFYQRIVALLQTDLPGRVVEIGSGIGNIKSALPQAICTDLFTNEWLDLVCDGYELPFSDATLSHLVLFDVFHHLETPMAFLREAHRVLVPGGRLIIFEPFLSITGRLVYGLFHHEPLGLGEPINSSPFPPGERRYYAAQGNATRFFFGSSWSGCPAGWECFHREAFSSFNYLLSGGYAKPAFYPEAMFGFWQRLDKWLSRCPRVFGARCLLGLRRLQEPRSHSRDPGS